MPAGSSKKRVSKTPKRTPTSKAKKRPASSDNEGESGGGSPTLYNLRQRDPNKQKRYDEDEERESEEIEEDEDEPSVQEEVEIRATSPTEGSERSETAPTVKTPKTTSAKTKEQQQALLPVTLKISLKRLKNLLKLPKARRWAYCEYFMADIDRALLQPDEEFRHCLRESFPDLRTRHLRKAEWRQVRRLIGKPRRYSQAFLEFEREDLEKKRRHIRDIQKGNTVMMDEEIDTPLKITLPLSVGIRVYARIRFPKDGIFAGTIDAIMDGRYRIIFDKDVVMPLIVSDYEIMRESPDELLPISFFLEQNKAPYQGPYAGGFLMTCEKLLASDEVLSDDGGTPRATTPTATSREERCGNYPLRMIVMIIKLSKLCDRKKALIYDLRELNFDGERLHLRGEPFNYDFQERYAEIVIELDQIDKQIVSYLTGIGEYVGSLLPQMTDVSVTSRPEALQRFCQMHSSQLVKHANSTVTKVGNKKVLEFITSLTAIMLQIRALGQQQCTAFELSSLKESIEDLKEKLDYKSRLIFEDDAEISLKHIEISMQQLRSIEPQRNTTSSHSANSED